MTKQLCALFLLLLAGLFTALEANAQANLSFQGILKKANGLAVDDGPYDITFTLYDAETAGTAVFTETKTDVEVAGGIYSVILGSPSTPLNASFNVPYFLGIRVGGPTATEMVPRIRLTSAPYALALRGSSNSFPGAGVVVADSIRSKGKIVARAGEPGTNSSLNNGYGFSAPGDRDGGMYSEADGQVAIWANNSERILVSNVPGDNRTYLRGNVTVDNSLAVSDQLTVTNQITANGNLNFGSNDGLHYNGLSDWRLVDLDIFSASNTNGWEATTAIDNATAPSTAPVLQDFSLVFGGYALRPSNESDFLKKQFSIDENVVGAFSQVKIKFKYYFLDSWDVSGSEGADLALAGFSTEKQGTTMAISWSQVGGVYGNNISNFYNGSGSFSDAATFGEMVMTKRDNGAFWVFFGAKMVGTDDENYAIGDIEVWVR